MFIKFAKYFSFLLLIIGIFTFLPSTCYAEEQAENTEQNKEDDTPKKAPSAVSGSCNLASMEGMYKASEGDTKKCWYCTVVIVMTNAFLESANTALPVMQTLGKLVVKLGFSIWLAFFILQQISSMGGISTGKMLQEILTMGFKCAFATYAISDGISFITTYILNPIMITGTDIGSALLDVQ